MAIAYNNPTGLFGNQSFTGDLGMDFYVDRPITITSLGAFDSSQNGFQHPITVEIYDLSTNSIVQGSQVTISGTQGTLIGSDRFVSLSTPLTLAAGFQGSIVAEYNGDRVYNPNLGGSATPPTTDSQNGALSFGGDRTGNLGQFPAGQFNTSAPLGAGTFQYTPSPSTVSLTVASESDLNNDIRSIDASTLQDVTYQISLSSGFSLSSDIVAINLSPASGNSVVINGNGFTINGGANGSFAPEFRGFFDYSGSLTLANLTIASTAAIGGNGSGGGAGLGGGLFVGAAGSATLDNVKFTGDIAVGGQGESGTVGGGGLGGNGGSLSHGGGGGGGIGQAGVSGQGGSNYSYADPNGVVPGAASGGSNSYTSFGQTSTNPGGADGGGGGAGAGHNGGFNGPSARNGGAGGGIGGLPDSGNPAINGGTGGFGGGGGAAGYTATGGSYGRSYGNGGDGGFGGGGGFGGNSSNAAQGQPGSGGFGGGGGGNGSRYFNPSLPSNAGFGGGAQGGGGLGAGGAVFVQQGGSLTIQGGAVSGGNAKGGTGSAYSGNANLNAGSGFGSGIFIQGNQTIHLAPNNGETLKIADVITDQNGSDPTGKFNRPGSGAVDIGGAGTVILTAADTYTGGTTIEAGATLQLGDGTTMGGVAGSVSGTGSLAFDAAGATSHVALSDAHNFSGKLLIEKGILDVTAPGSLGNGAFSGSGAIDLVNFAVTTTTWGPNDTLTLVGLNTSTAQAETETLHFDPDGFNGQVITASGTEQFLVAGGTLALTGGSGFFANGATLIGNGTVLSVLNATQLGGGPVTLNVGTQLNFATGTTVADPITVSGQVTVNIPQGQTVTVRGAVTSGSAPGSIAVTGGGHLVLNNGTLPVSYTYNVGSESAFNNAITAIDRTGGNAQSNVHYAINLTQSFSLNTDLLAVNLASGSSLTIDGGGHAIDGANSYRGLFVYAGDLTVDNLTIQNAAALGGAGMEGGGGGAGLGGGLFVTGYGNAGVGPHVTLDNVSFLNDSARGGFGGAGGSLGAGGGLGGPGGMLGGGGIGRNAAGGSSREVGGAGIIPGTASGGLSTHGLPTNTAFQNTELGGANGGGGGSLGQFGNAYGGGGGVGGTAGGAYATQYNGSGGFGGGGGWQAANGGFGGGGGPAGKGGFGGGGGARAHIFGMDLGNIGYGNFGGGDGSGSQGGGGGGGLGAGGAIFVQNGASLTIAGGSLSGGSVLAGQGQAGGGDGSAFGSGIFIQGNQTISFAPTTGETLTIADVIADQGDAIYRNFGELNVPSGTGNILVNGAGTVALFGANTFHGSTTIAAGTLELGNAQAASTGTITFASAAGATLEIDIAAFATASNNTFTFGNTIAGFAAGDTIDLAGVGGNGIGRADLKNNAAQHNVLEITENGHVYDLQLDSTASFAGEFFHLAAASGGAGAAITEDSSACYCPGTLILTDQGEVPIETLAIGDKVITMSGVARPIKWIGRRSYAGRFALGRKHILPICIKPGALDENLPRRDLWISPHHAMYLDGVLIEAKDLINDVSIVQAERVEKVEYFHIELDTHDVIVAEGAPSESFIDDDSRGMFHNAHEYPALYPDAPREPARYCAPRRDEGYELEAARRRIEARAGLRPAGESQPQALRGYVDIVSARRIAGWAQNTEHPEVPVCLDIFAGGRLIGQTLANHHRDDLARAGLGSGNHSFEFIPPAGLAFAPHALEVRRSLDGAALGLSIDARRGLARVA